MFRMAFFAALVPNTALAKQATAPHLEEGWAYVVDLVGTYQLWVPLVALAVAAVVVGRRLSGRALVAVALLPVGGLLHVGYVVVAGGDYAHARLLLPPLFALVAPVALLPVTRRAAVVAPLAVVAVWAVVAAGWLRPGDAARDPDQGLLPAPAGPVRRGAHKRHAFPSANAWHLARHRFTVCYPIGVTMRAIQSSGSEWHLSLCLTPPC